MIPDVNVLVAALRADHPHHAIAHEWLKQTLLGIDGARLVLLPMVMVGTVRIVSNPAIFEDPTPVSVALAYVEALRDSAVAECVSLGDEWTQFMALCNAFNLSGNAITDAWIAAVAEHRGERLVSFDRSFKRYLKKSQVDLLTPSKPPRPPKPLKPQASPPPSQTAARAPSRRRSPGPG